jgi:DNA replication protein DnaC
MTTSLEAKIAVFTKALKLPTVGSSHAEAGQYAEKNGWGFMEYLHHLLEMEVDDRRRRRVERNLHRSGLPHDKTLATLDRSHLPPKVTKLLPVLCGGGFADRAENILAFGNPGTGKSHVAAAIGHELVQKGYQVMYTPTFRLVHQLLAAKKELQLERLLARLDRMDTVILDDIGYVQQDRDEMEVLFTFLSERYERRSVILTSNLVFSQWDKIFKDPMTTAAAIDRLVHHATILELTGKSFRTEAAKTNNTRSRSRKPHQGEEST